MLTVVFGVIAVVLIFGLVFRDHNAEASTHAALGRVLPHAVLLSFVAVIVNDSLAVGG